MIDIWRLKTETIQFQLIGFFNALSDLRSNLQIYTDSINMLIKILITRYLRRVAKSKLKKKEMYTTFFNASARLRSAVSSASDCRSKGRKLEPELGQITFTKITKTSLFKYTEHFNHQKMKIFR